MPFFTIGMKPKKQFGQNFLTQPKIAQDIVNAGELSKKDTVIEIGPGKGMLTEKILETGAKLIAIEKDADLISGLNEKFEKEIKRGQLKILNKDVRDLNVEALGIKKYKLIANIPYYITGEILRTFLENKFQPEKMVLMVQREVAERICAKNGKESILSISVKIYGLPKIIRRVSAGSFFPKPRVDSSVLMIEKISKDNFEKNKITEQHFFELLKKGFKSPRKQLGPNLNFRKDEWYEICKKIEMDEKVRPENLSVENWISLSQHQ
ncbi:MAG: 16S rRNA (adenine(1518)-N(6)/adenine(1519)-N(6))-dimethyltransferase RsmA [Minisyncoccia bacterium]